MPTYEDGLAFFVAGLGWTCTADVDQGRKRWVTVTPDPPSGTQFVLSVPTTKDQRDRLGAQTADRVAFFLETDDLERDAARIVAAGGRFLEDPRHEVYGTVAQWRDPFGNLWDLFQPAGG